MVGLLERGDVLEENHVQGKLTALVLMLTTMMVR